ncbi:MAG TPA: hypothetical protein VIV60_12395 [Polyangiaceae bacterium]
MSTYLERLALRGADAGIESITRVSAVSGTGLDEEFGLERSDAWSDQQGEPFAPKQNEPKRDQYAAAAPDREALRPGQPTDIDEGSRQERPHRAHRGEVNPVRATSATKIVDDRANAQLPFERVVETIHAFHDVSSGIPARAAGEVARAPAQNPESRLSADSGPQALYHEVSKVPVEPQVIEHQAVELKIVEPEVRPARRALEPEPPRAIDVHGEHVAVKHELALPEFLQARTRLEPMFDSREFVALVDRLESLIERFERNQNTTGLPLQSTVPVSRSPLNGFGEFVAQRRHADRRWY